jgi:hypothetical protein
MRAIAHGWKPDKKGLNIPKSVAKEYVRADKRKKGRKPRKR